MCSEGNRIGLASVECVAALHNGMVIIQSENSVTFCMVTVP